MRRPIILLCGPAGVGKSTIADQLAASYGFKVVSQADPIKDIAKALWAFTDEELWGPSEARNKVVSTVELLSRVRPHNCVSYDSTLAPGSIPSDETLSLIASAVAGFPTAPSLRKLAEDFILALQVFAEKNAGLSARVVLQLLGTEVGRAYYVRIWTNAAIQKARNLIDPLEGVGAPGVVIPDGRFRSEVMAADEAGCKIVLVRGTGIETRGAEQHVSETEIFTIPDHFFDAIIENDKSLGKEAWVGTGEGCSGIHSLMTNLFPTVAIRGCRHFDDSLADGKPYYYAETFYHGTKGGRG